MINGPVMRHDLQGVLYFIVLFTILTVITYFNESDAGYTGDFLSFLTSQYIFGPLVGASAAAYLTLKVSVTLETKRQLSKIKKYQDNSGSQKDAAISKAFYLLMKRGLLGGTKFAGLRLQDYSFQQYGFTKFNGAVFAAMPTTRGQAKKNHFTNMDFSDLDLSETIFGISQDNIILPGEYEDLSSKLTDCNFANAVLKSVKFDRCQMIWGADSAGAFVGADMGGASFVGADMQNADFRGALNIEKADFTGATGLETCLFDDEETKQRVMGMAKVS